MVDQLDIESYKNNFKFRRYVYILGVMNEINYLRLQKIESYIKENIDTLKFYDFQSLVFGFSSYFCDHTYDINFLDFLSSKLQLETMNNG